MKKRVAILCNETKNSKLTELLDIYFQKQYKKPPKNCVECNGKSICQLEIVGIDKPYLFWECIDCGKKHLRYSKSYTYKLLKEIDEFYINPDDFIEIQNKEMN